MDEQPQQSATGSHIAQATGGATATVNDHSSHAEFDQRFQQVSTQINAAPGAVIQVDVTSAALLPKRWTRPVPPPVQERMIPRPQEMAYLVSLLEERRRDAAAGRVGAVALQGMAGSGKTVLATLVANQIADRFPDGVLWTEIGPSVKSAAHVQPHLNTWASHCIGPVDDAELQRMLFDADAVRTLLAEHPNLLVVLDNVWSLPAVQPLRRALPAGACLLLTTRSRTIMRELGGGAYELPRLQSADARTLVHARLSWQPTSDEDDVWVNALIEGVGHHPLALDVALGQLRRAGDYPSEWRDAADRIVDAVRHGRNLDHLQLDPDDREHNVEAVLAFSYDALTAEERARFSALGAFALDADFSTDIAAAVWDLDHETARRQLVDFANAALITRRDEQNWRQHALLRGYALGWLHTEGNRQGAAARHAFAYAAAMRTADDAQRFYDLLPALPQLRHAFAWAIDVQLELAQDLIANTANLLAAFGLAAEGLTWCEQALNVAQRSGTSEQVARAQGSLGNALSRVASLPDEDRRQRLYDALAAYEEALRHYRPDTAPLAYAATQNNRATILSELASLPDEDRRQRLYDALAAYEEALRHYRPDTAPLAYAATQNNRATILSELASLPDEDRRQRLYDALAAYEEALRHYRPDTAPLAYAATQNNRANRLSELASLPDEDRRQRLYDALAAYEEALRHYRPDTAPLDYAMTQNNRANILSELASLPDEDRRQRLYDALAAYEEALRHYRPDTAPLAYAATQNNRATILSELASLPDEDRRQRLYDALAAYEEALRHYRPDTAPLDYAMTQNNRANRLSELASLPDEDRRQRLYDALAAYEEALRHYRPDTAPLDYAMTQNNRANRLSELASLPDEDRRQRLTEALMCTVEALVLFSQLQHVQYENAAANTLYRVRIACGDDFPALWQELDLGDPPQWLVDAT